MTNQSLAENYFTKAKARFKILAVLMAEDDFSDVVRESQEIVELILKGVLRQAGVEPPKWHDVGELIVENRKRLSVEVDENADRIAVISRRLRKERELAFYGDIDFIPSEEYSKDDAECAVSDAKFVMEIALD